MVVVLLAVAVWLLCAGLAALIAQSKGRSAGAFALAGFLLGPFGVLYAAFADSAKQRRARKNMVSLDEATRLAKKFGEQQPE